MPDLAMPLVSACVPVFNGGADLERALDSILEQTYQNMEIVISDNGSSDGTGEICARAAARDPRVRVIRRTETIGSFEHYRFIRDQAKGKYFFWAPHDDMWDSRFVEAGVRALENNPNALAAMGSVVYRRRNGAFVGRDDPPYHLDEPCKLARVRYYLRHRITDNLYYSMYRREALDHYGWPSSLTPDKTTILHVLCRGPIADAPGMEYTNYLSEKSLDEVADVFALSRTHAFTNMAKAFRAGTVELWHAFPPHQFIRVWVRYVRAEHWHRFFARTALEWIAMRLARRSHT